MMSLSAAVAIFSLLLWITTFVPDGLRVSLREEDFLRR